MVLNAQDLFLFMDKHDHSESSVLDLPEVKWQLMSSSLLMNKPKEKSQLLAKAILDDSPEVVMMTEVGGIESLKNFAQHLLQDQYEAYSLPSNSDRGIDLGYLIKKNIPFEARLKTHKNHPLPMPAFFFSRDVLRMDLLQNGRPYVIFLLAHIKSKLDLARNDFEGRSRRVHEVNGLVDIYLKLEKEFPDIPIFIGGDMNGIAGEIGTEEEFKSLYEKTDLRDVAFMAGIPEEERFSYVYFNRGGNRYEQQIDYLFLSQKFSSAVIKEECYFPRYKNLDGFPLPIPKSYENKSTLPSDHYPFLGSFKLP